MSGSGIICLLSSEIVAEKEGSDMCEYTLLLFITSLFFISMTYVFAERVECSVLQLKTIRAWI